MVTPHGGRRRWALAGVVGAALLVSGIVGLTLPAGASSRRSRIPPRRSPDANVAVRSAQSAIQPQTLGAWRMLSSYVRPGLTSDQGLATATTTAGTPAIVYRGELSIPLRLRLQGWEHVGDPGAGGPARRYVFDAYQGPATATSKLYEVTTPSGRRYDFVHPLDASIHEAFNNSFAAISPDGRWMVSGEWGDMDRLLVFPAPVLDAAPNPTGDTPLALSGLVTLDQSVHDVQGCDFVTSTSLLCSADSPQRLLQVDLTQPLSGSPTDPATVTPLGPLPLRSSCAGTFEAEGIDYYAPTGQMRVEVIPPSPCSVFTTVYVYRRT